ncbi:MAG: hypothetical protein ACFNKF_08435, partial [Treponema lecithinolyticum]|uniref:hypothetical protein n=1 Tax=Treponema lecithinolyticum TaxID=53418 RepID=UPI00361C3867
FKASLLIEEAQDDPMKRADTIRSMIESISKISDPIKREIYVRECAKIMEISEEVLFASLAQMNQQQLLKAQQELKKVQKSIFLNTGIKQLLLEKSYRKQDLRRALCTGILLQKKNFFMLLPTRWQNG